MQLSSNEKTSVLLKALELQFNEIRYRDDRRLKLFEWAASLLVASFGVMVALATANRAFPNVLAIKLIASAMVLLPTILAVRRIEQHRKSAQGNAKAIEQIEDLLHLFEKEYYGSTTVFPTEWQGKFVNAYKARSFFAIILIPMVLCVLMTIWILL